MPTIVAPPRSLRGDPVSQPRVAQPLQIADRVLAAGQDDEVVVAAPAATSIQSAHVSSRKSVAFDRHGSRTIAIARARGRGVPRRVSQREAVFGVERDVVGVRKDAQARRAVRSSSMRTPSSKSDASPRNWLIAKPRNKRALLGRQQLDGAQDRGEDAAALDVRDEHPRRAEPA